MEISLSNLKWEVKGYWPYVPLKEKSMETGQTLHGVTSWIPAQVPGGVHRDLFCCGMIENPYFGMNSLKCEWVENRWWMYRTSFSGKMQGKNLLEEKVSLCFQGLDYETILFFNDEKIGEHQGMYEATEIDITGKIRENNTLLVLFKGIPKEMGQIGYTSRTSTQKSRFNYKWDFSTRLVNIGFWKGVVLKIHEKAELVDCCLNSDYDGNYGKISFSAFVKDYRRKKEIPLNFQMKVTGPWNHNSQDVKILLEKQEHHTEQIFIMKNQNITGNTVQEEIEVKSPELWYPNGSGEQPLYCVEVQICEAEKVLFTKEWNQGIRSIEFVHNENEHENALPYTFVINGRKTYIKGINMTPLDHLYGNIGKEQYTYLVTTMVNAGVNLVRIWGGGLIEKEEFYELCDENGILIWQEFIQSSSGIDNIPCTSKEFLKLLEKNSIAAVKEKRNHTALAVYSGGNELMKAENSPVSFENKNIQMLKKIVETYDPGRYFLPTSASGPREFLSEEKRVSHDVHGSWRYEGNPKHYKMYGESDNLFHSEFGMDGTSSVKSLRKFLPEKSLHPTPMSGDPIWQHHGEWWGTYFRDCEIFGEIERTSKFLPLFVDCSQYMQGEGLRFIIEADRRRAFQNSGVIVWQLNEPWPNASCTNLIDYYGETKPAYYQLKNAYENMHISMDYRNLVYNPGSQEKWPIYISNSGNGETIAVRARAFSKDGSLLYEKKEKCFAETNKTVQAMEISMEIPEKSIFYILLQGENESGIISENMYILGTEDTAVLNPLTRSKAYIEIKKEVQTQLEDGRIEKKLSLCNSGSEIAVQIGIELQGSYYRILGKENYFSMLPGEEKEIKFLLIPSAEGVFEEIEENKSDQVNIHWMGKYQ